MCLKRFDEKGITLIEVLVSITIFSIFLLTAYFVMGTGYKLFDKNLKSYKAESAVRDFFRVFDRDKGRITQVNDNGFQLNGGVQYRIDGSSVLRSADTENIFDFGRHNAGLIEFKYLDSDLKETRSEKRVKFIRVKINLDSGTKEKLFPVNDIFN